MRIRFDSRLAPPYLTCVFHSDQTVTQAVLLHASFINHFIQFARVPQRVFIWRGFLYALFGTSLSGRILFPTHLGARKNLATRKPTSVTLPVYICIIVSHSDQRRKMPVQ